MIRNILLAHVLLIALSITPAKATFLTNGNDMLSQCRENAVFETYCKGYIMGAIEGTKWIASISEVKDAFPALGICMPQGVTSDQVYDITLGFAQANPQLLHLGPQELAYMAMKKLFSCSPLVNSNN